MSWALVLWSLLVLLALGGLPQLAHSATDEKHGVSGMPDRRIVDDYPPTPGRLMASDTDDPALIEAFKIQRHREGAHYEPRGCVVSSYLDKIAELKKRVTDIAAEVGKLTARRKEFAFAASEGDVKARKEIADTDHLLQAQQKEFMTLTSALETAEALEKQAQAEAEASADKERRIAAGKVASAVCALHTEIDHLLVELRECFERRESLLRELGNSALVSAPLLVRMSGKALVTAAAAHVGLGRFLALEMTPVIARAPLVASNAVLSGLTKHEQSNPPRTERPKLKERKP